MGVYFTARESSALYELVAENATDIVLKTDRAGFIVHASHGIERLGLSPPSMLIGPHLLDLVHPSWAEAVRFEFAAALDDTLDGAWIEFLALTDRWFEIQLRGLIDEHGRAYGTVGIMRSIEARRTLEDRLFAATLTDPLTGLTNRTAFIAMLQHLLDKRIGGCLAIFAIDHFKAINMRYGQATGDEVLVVFANFLQCLLRSQDIVSRIGGESLAVLLPRATPDEAEAVCRRIIAALAEINHAAGVADCAITASAGVARIEGSLDCAMRSAELALTVARAKGRNRLEMGDGPPPGGSQALLR